MIIHGQEQIPISFIIHLDQPVQNFNIIKPKLILQNKVLKFCKEQYLHDKNP